MTGGARADEVEEKKQKAIMIFEDATYIQLA
jgi:hypothetical protein